MESGILNYGIRNTAEGIRNPTKVPSSTTNPEFRARNPEPKTVLDVLTWGDLCKLS